MYDYPFTLDSNEIDTSSSVFWSDLIATCFSQSSQWTTFYLPNTISCLLDNTPSTRSTPMEYFNDWLYNKFGPQRTNSNAGYYMKQSQLFVLYETVSYQSTLSSSYKVNQAISVAGFVTAILGLVASAGVISVIGAVAGTAGLIAAGTKINEYTLSIGMIKQVTVQGGSIIHASATKAIHYTGYANPDTGYSAVDEGSEISSYYPTEELFEDNDLLIDAAWNHFRNP